MSGAYKWKKLSDCDINDCFFDSLKEDYPGFETWYNQKALEGKEAFTYYDEFGLGAFVMLKFDEEEEIQLCTGSLPIEKRLKISTLKLSERIQGNRLGEGAIGIALWKWLECNCNEIYVTVFPKHKKLIEMLGKFGFIFAGNKPNGECVYLKSKKKIDFSTPYTSFPFVNAGQDKCYLLPIEAEWHDKLFPYSELKNTIQQTEEFAAANGVTKTYICFPCSNLSYSSNHTVLIYRKGINNKQYTSIITSYGTIVRCVKIKQGGIAALSFEQYKNIVGNKSVFTDEEIKDFYMNKSNLYVIELVYNHAFGMGNNVNHLTLKNNSLWKDVHPFNAEYSMADFINILHLAKQDTKKLILK